jgi:hypothetical protein
MALPRGNLGAARRQNHISDERLGFLRRKRGIQHAFMLQAPRCFGNEPKFDPQPRLISRQFLDQRLQLPG